MNVKRLVLSCIAVFIFIFGFSWIFHGMLLKPIYVSTASLWRTDVEMEHYFGWLMLGQFVMAIGFCAIYARFAPMATGACSVCSATAYGFLTGILFGGNTLIVYAVQPLPAKLIFIWFIGDIFQMVIAGAILGAIYKPAAGIAEARQPAPARTS